MNKKNILGYFGRKLIEEVRDEVIDVNNLIMEGKMGSNENKYFHKRFQHLSPQAKELIKDFVKETVDKTMHHFLWMIEQNEQYDLIKYNGSSLPHISLREISDGLCGELYSEEGWIEKFSKYPPTTT